MVPAQVPVAEGQEEGWRGVKGGEPWMAAPKSPGPPFPCPEAWSPLRSGECDQQLANPQAGCRWTTQGQLGTWPARFSKDL